MMSEKVRVDTINVQPTTIIPTLNQMGYMFTNLTSYDEEFIKFCEASGGPALDIGAAFGVASLRVARTKTPIYANDLSRDHLDCIEETCPEGHREFLTTIPGAFPDDISLPSSHLTAILASNIFHYLTGDQIIRGIEKMHGWLKPQGKVFLIVGTPYARMWQSFIPAYEKNIKENIPWPGYIEDIESVQGNNRGPQIPRFMHFLPLPLLERLFQDQGFRIEKSGYHPRHDWPQDMQMDGKESAAIVAVKE